MDFRPRDYRVYFGGIFLWEEKQNIVKKLNWRLLKIFNLYIRLINRIKIVLFFPFLFIFVEK